MSGALPVARAEDTPESKHAQRELRRARVDGEGKQNGINEDTKCRLHHRASEEVPHRGSRPSITLRGVGRRAGVSTQNLLEHMGGSGEGGVVTVAAIVARTKEDITARGRRIMDHPTQVRQTGR